MIGRLVNSDYSAPSVRTVTTGTDPSLDLRESSRALATLPTRGRSW